MNNTRATIKSGAAMSLVLGLGALASGLPAFARDMVVLEEGVIEGSDILLIDVDPASDNASGEAASPEIETPTLEDTAVATPERAPDAETLPEETAVPEPIEAEVTPIEEAPVAATPELESEPAPLHDEVDSGAEVMSDAETLPEETAVPEPVEAEVMPMEESPSEPEAAPGAGIQTAPTVDAPATNAGQEQPATDTSPVEVAPVEVAPVEVAPVEVAPLTQDDIETPLVEGDKEETMNPSLDSPATPEAGSEKEPRDAAPAPTEAEKDLLDEDRADDGREAIERRQDGSKQEGRETAQPQAEPDATQEEGSWDELVTAFEELRETIASGPDEISPDALAEAQRASGREAVKAAEAKEAKKNARERERDREERLRIFGAAAAGAVVGALLPDMGGRLVGQQGDRAIIQQGDALIVRSDETRRLLTNGSVVEVEDLAEGRSRVTVTRPEGSQIVTIRDSAGYLVRRFLRLSNGEEIVMFEEIDTSVFDTRERRAIIERAGPPRRRVVTYMSRSTPLEIETALMAPPQVVEDDRYSLRELRENNQIRWQAPSLELDAITFASGSAEIDRGALPSIHSTGQALASLIQRSRGEMFLIEGHTDAVGSDISNLVLSDLRAEAVASLLTQVYGVPPENLIVQGYGEQDLLVPSLSPSTENRRVAIRRITPLIR